ncbi:hypothetical protein [Micromonospora sp. NBC_01638]|uniref:hypothetical protein n=1 Tax=Micromonospora sp. NBC_01638 TaxID=2975982 RepID=UPI003869CEFB|nr:hypothetical protein OG811_07705 [Micromonospora sp. NBC_01638]
MTPIHPSTHRGGPLRPRRSIAALAIAAAAVTVTALGVAPTAASAAPTDLFISEYVDPRPGVLAAGQTSVAFPVTVRGDRKRESDEKLTLLVAGVPGLRLADPLAVGIFTNDD